MSLRRFFPIPFIVAALAFALQLLDQQISQFMPIPNNLGFGWVAFIAWSLYFAAGGDLAGGRKVLYAYLYGIPAAIGILTASAALAGHVGSFAAPIALFFGVAVTLFLERLPPLDFIPAIFIAAATFFGLMTYVPGATYLSAAVTELSYCVIGLVFGWVSVLLRSAYEASRNVAKSD